MIRELIAELTEEEKLAFIEKQIRAACRADTDMIVCPYCKGVNQQSRREVCCPTFGVAALAVLHRLDAEQTRENAERVMEAASRN